MTQTTLTIWGNGQGSVSGPWLNRAIQNVDNYAALRAAPGIQGMVAYAQGAVTQNDGGQGTFAWDQSSTAADDNSSIIVPYGYTQGAWVLQPLTAGALGPNSVTLSNLQQIAADTILSNLTGATANVAANTTAAVTAALSYATTSAQGVVKLATNAQAIAGTSTTLAVTPSGLAAALNASALGITTTGSTSISVPGASAAVGTVGSSGSIIFNSSLIINWAYVQFQDVNAQTPTTWTFASPNQGTNFSVAPLMVLATNACALAGQGANANRGVLSLNSISNSSSSWILRDTAMTDTLGAWMVAAIGF